MQRLEQITENRLKANLATSAFFAVVHVPTQGLVGLTVFVPSLIFGWLYQARRDIVLVTLLHAIANLVYAFYIVKFVPVLFRAT